MAAINVSVSISHRSRRCFCCCFFFVGLNFLSRCVLTACCSLTSSSFKLLPFTVHCLWQSCDAIVCRCERVVCTYVYIRVLFLLFSLLIHSRLAFYYCKSFGIDRAHIYMYICNLSYMRKTRLQTIGLVTTATVAATTTTTMPNDDVNDNLDYLISIRNNWITSHTHTDTLTHFNHLACGMCPHVCVCVYPAAAIVLDRLLFFSLRAALRCFLPSFFSFFLIFRECVCFFRHFTYHVHEFGCGVLHFRPVERLNAIPCPQYVSHITHRISSAKLTDFHRCGRKRWPQQTQQKIK